MGMFDSVKFREKCPNCDGVVTGQSKGGPCNLNMYDSESVPVCVAESLRYVCCDMCSTPYDVCDFVSPTVSLELKQLETKEKEDDHQI